MFDLGFPNLVDGKGLNLPHNVTIDPYSTPNHIYVSDGMNDRPPESRARVVRRENFRPMANPPTWYSDSPIFTTSPPITVVNGCREAGSRHFASRSG